MAYTVVNYWVTGYAVGDDLFDLQKTLQGVGNKTIVELFDFELNAVQHETTIVYRFTNTKNELGNDIVWQGNTYTAIPIEATGYEATGKGSLPRPSISVANLLGTFTTIIALLPDGLEGCKVTRTRTLAKYLDAVNFGAPSNFGSASPFTGTYSSTGSLVQVGITGTNPGFKIGDMILFDGTSGTNLLDGRHELYSVSQSGNTYYLFFNVSTGGSQSQESCTVKLQNEDPDPTSYFRPRDIYFIDRKSMENRDVVSYEMCSAFDLAGVRLPKRQILPDDFPGVGTFSY